MSSVFPGNFSSLSFKIFPLDTRFVHSNCALLGSYIGLGIAQYRTDTGVQLWWLMGNLGQLVDGRKVERCRT